MIEIALYQPDIAGNVGAILRLAACLGAGVDLIEPMGFAWSDKARRRSAMVDSSEGLAAAPFDSAGAALSGEGSPPPGTPLLIPGPEISPRCRVRRRPGDLAYPRE